MAAAPTDRLTDQVAQPRPDSSPPRAAPMIALTHPSPRRAAGVIALAWLPAVVLAAGLPRFVPSLTAGAGSCPLTEALMSIGRLGPGPIVLAGTGLVAAMAAIGFGWVRAGLPCRRAVAFALAAAGLGAFAVGMAGTLGPLLTVRIS